MFSFARPAGPAPAAIDPQDAVTRVADGSLTLIGGQYEFDAWFLLVNVSLTLGEPGGADDTYVIAKATGGVSALLNKGLSGIGTFEVSNVATHARFPSGATLAPGHSIGDLKFKGRASFESGSTLALPSTSPRRNSGGSRIARHSSAKPSPFWS